MKQFLNSRNRQFVVLIPTYNRLNQLTRCIESVRKNTSVAYDLIVIDGGSTDGTRDYLKKQKDLTPVFFKKIGIVRSENLVLKKLKCSYVTSLNDDQELLPGSFDSAISILENYPAIGLVSLKMKDTVGPYSSYAYEVGFSQYGILNASQSVIRFPLYKSMGFHDDRFYFYTADSDLTAAVLCSGYDVVTMKKLCVLHHRNWSKNLTKADLDENFKTRSLGIDGMKIYNEKYAFLGKMQWKKTRNHTIKTFIYRHLFSQTEWGKRQYGIMKETVESIVRGRFVSPIDPILNLGKPYHLVQRIPRQILDTKENPYLRVLC